MDHLCFEILDWLRFTVCPLCVTGWEMSDCSVCPEEEAEEEEAEEEEEEQSRKERNGCTQPCMLVVWLKMTVV